MLVITCSETRATFTLARQEADYWQADLKGRELSCSASVYAFMGDGIDEFFRSMARDWRGWDGVRSWSSLEGELELEASSDGRGHTRLRLRMALDPARDWRIDVVLVIEAGSLDELAAGAKALVTGG